MKKWILLFTSLVGLSACTVVLPPAATVDGHRCIVRDSSGRIWEWKSATHPCRKAQYDCKRWHLEHPGERNAHCSIIND